MKAFRDPVSPIGRHCAFCGKMGGTGFSKFVIEGLGGRPGARHAHGPCVQKAVSAFRAKWEKKS